MKTFAQLLALLLLPALLLGCGADANSGDDHADHEEGHHDDHEEASSGGHDHGADFPKNFSEAVAKIDSVTNSIKNAYDADNIEAADQGIHEVGHVIGHLPEWVDSSDLSDEDKKAAKEAGDKLFEIFGKLHGENHGASDTAYGEVSMELEEAIALLKSKAASLE